MQKASKGVIVTLMEQKRKLTGWDVLNWHGSDHEINELAQVLADILNGDYPIELAKEEIGDYNEV